MAERKVADPERWGKKRGVFCPECECPRSRVSMTRSRAGSVHRWRICDECGTRYPTREVLFDKNSENKDTGNDSAGL